MSTYKFIFIIQYYTTVLHSFAVNKKYKRANTGDVFDSMEPETAVLINIRALKLNV